MDMKHGDFILVYFYFCKLISNIVIGF